MPVLDASEPLAFKPHRILIGGTSGSGKTTLARSLAAALALPYVEIDALHHGPNWTRRPTFVADVETLAARPEWITEYQYAEARSILLESCDLVVYLALSRRVVMHRVVQRTIRRSRHREVLWNGNIEPPLRTILTDRDHIIRWAWRTHDLGPKRIESITSEHPALPVVVLRSPRDVAFWLAKVVAKPHP